MTALIGKDFFKARIKEFETFSRGTYSAPAQAALFDALSAYEEHQLKRALVYLMNTTPPGRTLSNQQIIEAVREQAQLDWNEKKLKERHDAAEFFQGKRAAGEYGKAAVAVCFEAIKEGRDNNKVFDMMIDMDRQFPGRGWVEAARKWEGKYITRGTA